MKLYFYNLLIGIDQFANVIFGGAPDECISSRLYRHREHWSAEICMYTVDSIFYLFFGQEDHCRKSHEGGDRQMEESLK